ncbi:glutathione S-transferase family protein [Methylobacterium planeticum]|uniref:GST C-terminal domain-containing protein n=1 Tax=Methylobacterium planeticum TaxID=2615211 RepID=A0A6N6MSH3_9HYPH|nr:hypothetical protein [Methylobacterium planeticum]KAB1073455.1 hypothetical protein F6X51_11985 [Methylobacterium planeticum]
MFDPKVTSDARAAATASLNRSFALIEQTLSDGRPFLTGMSSALPDGYLFVVQAWAPMTGFDLGPFPRLTDLAGRVATRPSVREALAAERKREERA